MRDMFDAGPRLARLLASHQRWLLTQVAYALSMERVDGDASSGLTATALTSEITAFKAASRNTIRSYIDEVATYKFITCVPGEERKRPRRYEVAETAQQAMVGWVWSNLLALDVLDDGDRAERFRANPGWIRMMQPRIARDCLRDPAWREPPKRVGLFMWNDAGGLIVDYLMSRIDPEDKHPDRLFVGPIDSRALAADFMISRTHLQRLFAKATQDGFMGWDVDKKKPPLWISRAFVEEYCQWQAIKFAYVDQAFHAASEMSGKQ
ncbi:hypothetical protein [Rhizobium metallidurans]|uniref:AraC-like DNA-binding protein n=1 Tax=Rhizobium metallidurans TaxID=1265931 RepID=A0A7W6GAB5_9HYPH|nr:AraC-like DNA-binding protein [Rhizobium metallidurans]